MPGQPLCCAAPASEKRKFEVSWADLPEMLEKVDVIPHQQNGQVVGYYANYVDDRIRNRTGLQSGDLVLAINGIPLNDDFNEVKLFQQIQKDVIQLDIKRKGQAMQLAYQIKK